jgi:hypothetical protein
MDLGTIVITLVFIAIVTVPFVLTGYSKKRKKKNLFHRLTEMAENEGCAITQHEFCGDFLIGLDEVADRLFFFKKSENHEIVQSVNLMEYKSCRLVNSNRTVGDKKTSYSVIDKLELCFYPNDKSKPDILVELYNDEYDSLTLSGELQLAEKWEKLLNERMKTSKKSKADATTQSASTVAVTTRQQPQKRVAV